MDPGPEGGEKAGGASWGERAGGGGTRGEAWALRGGKREAAAIGGLMDKKKINK